MGRKDKILKEIFDYHTARLKPALSALDAFCNKSLNHFNIVLLLGSSSNECSGFSYEVICQLYHRRYASRTTILSILNEGIEKNIFIKQVNSEDHRKQDYKLTHNVKKNVLNWLENHPIRNI